VLSLPLLSFDLRISASFSMASCSPLKIQA
jgi:hypothetical protein